MININESIYNQQFTFHHSPLAQLHYTPGIWVNGNYYWLQNNREKIMVEEGITINVKEEQVHSNIQMNQIYVTNHTNQRKEVKILSMHHHSRISPEHFTFVSPKDKVIFHIANKEVFLVKGQCNGKSMNEYTIQPYWNVFTDRIWSSKEKGHLKYQPLAKGAAASIFTMKAEIDARKTIKLHSWMIRGNSKQEIIQLDKALLKNTLAFPFEK
jgi:hypothetical protein